MRTETVVEGQTTIMLVDSDAQVTYMYFPDTNMAMKMSFEEPDSPIEDAESIPDFNPVILGTETLDGKVCLVVEYTFEGITVKMWVWKDNGFPIRVEMTTPEGDMVMEYRNYDFGDIPDSKFELPEGVQIQEIPGM